jgi:membrane protein implicated in regulation of membrane protease activity
MSKDKLFGAIIFVVGILLIVFYLFWGPLDLYFASTSYPAGLQWLYDIPGFNWKWAVVLPLFLVVLLVGVIAIWIGYSMITTPPPVPLEELEEELEAEEAASAAAEKKA